MSPITTHVLDLATGRPARGVGIVLSAQGDDGRWVEVARGATDDDGRLRDLLPDGPIPAPRVYALRFDSGAFDAGDSCVPPKKFHNSFATQMGPTSR